MYVLCICAYVHFNVVGVDIDFVQSAYTFNEYDGTREVCATTLNETTYDFNVNINIQVEDVATSSATGIFADSCVV